MSLNIYLFKDGEKPRQEEPDYPLTEIGREAARNLALLVAGVSFSRVLTSPLKRARQTCEIATSWVAPRIDPDLTEWAGGASNGNALFDVVASGEGWGQDGRGSIVSESPVQVTERADLVINRLCEMQGNIALFSHHYFGRRLVDRWMARSGDPVENPPAELTSVTILTFENDDPAKPSVMPWNHDSTEPKNPLVSPEPMLQRWENEGGET